MKPEGRDPTVPSAQARIIVTDREPDARREIMSMAMWYASIARDLRARRDAAVAEWDERIDLAEQQAVIWKRASESVGLPDHPTWEE